MTDRAIAADAALRDANSQLVAVRAELKDVKRSRVRYSAWSAVAAIVLVATGAQWVPGYQLDSTAAAGAGSRATDAVSEVMAQICAERFLRAPDVESRIAGLNSVSGSWEKAGYIRDGSWAMKPDGLRPDFATAERCSELIVTRLSAGSQDRS